MKSKERIAWKFKHCIDIIQQNEYGCMGTRRQRALMLLDRFYMFLTKARWLCPCCGSGNCDITNPDMLGYQSVVCYNCEMDSITYPDPFTGDLPDGLNRRKVTWRRKAKEIWKIWTE